jgi:signal transduction histidine kinase
MPCKQRTRWQITLVRPATGEHTRLAVMALGPAWQFTYLNSTAGELLGRDADELLGRCAREEFAYLGGTPLDMKLEQVMNVRLAAAFDLFCRPRRVWLRVRAFPLSEGLMIYIRDITPQKRLERALRQHRRRLEAMASELGLAEERERRRIAEHLHDRIGQMLLLAKLKVRGLRKRDEAAPLVNDLDELTALMDELIGESRSLSVELSPSILYEAGLEAAVRWLADKAQREYGFRVEVQVDDQPKPLAEADAVCLFQVVRELLANIAKHARAGVVRLAMRRSGGRLLIELHDDGVGFDPGRQRSGNGMGLFLTRQRLEHLGGTFRIVSAAGRGTQASLAIRLKQ